MVIKNWIERLGKMHRDRALALTRLECAELENVFALLLVGSFIGFPAPPSFIALELMPLMEKELAIFGRRAYDSKDMLGELLGVMGVD